MYKNSPSVSSSSPFLSHWCQSAAMVDVKALYGCGKSWEFECQCLFEMPAQIESEQQIPLKAIQRPFLASRSLFSPFLHEPAWGKKKTRCEVQKRKKETPRCISGAHQRWVPRRQGAVPMAVHQGAGVQGLTRERCRRLNPQLGQRWADFIINSHQNDYRTYFLFLLRTYVLFVFFGL